MTDDSARTSTITPGESWETMSQAQLVALRFSKHKLAVISLYALVVLYLIATFAEFFAPYTSEWRDLDHSYCPPQTVNFSFARGFYTYAVRRHVDPITFRKTYMRDESDIVPLSLFVRGEPYDLWGFIPITRHFFGVNHAAYTPPAALDEQLQPDQSAIPNRQSEIGNRQSAVPTFYLLGADKYGRDVLTRMIYGARISLSVGLIGIACTFLFGIVIGGISGYLGGWTDIAIQRFIEIINSFPHLPLWLALAAALPGDWPPLRVYFAITILLSLLNWTGLARVVRGKILSLREEDYAMAARLLGASHGRVLFRHLLPGFTSHIIVTLTLSVPGMILGETSLSFLGLGLRPPIVSWGVMLQDCMDIKVINFYPWLLLPMVFIVLTVLCFNFLGDGLRDAADPYSAR
jgi:peptide/nickel transport system permease protein